MIKHIVQYAVTKPKHIWVLTVLVVAVSLWQVMRLQQDGRIEALIPPDNPQVLLRNAMEKHFGSSTFILIGAPIKNLNSVAIEEAKHLALALSKNPQVKEVHSIFSKNYLENTVDGFDSKPIAEQQSDGHYSVNAILRNLKSDPIYHGNLWGLEGSSIPLLVEFEVGTTDQQATEWVENTLQLTPTKLQWNLSGLPVIQHEMKRFMDRDMGVLVPMFVIAILILLYLSFRSWIGVLVPLAPITVSVLATYALMAGLGIKITMVTNLVPMLLIAIGATCSIHFINQYFREIGEDKTTSAKGTVISSGSHIGRVIFLASITTVVGFLSNLFNPVTAIRDFAIALAFGVSSLFLLNITLVPSILASLSKPSTLNSGLKIGWFNRALDSLLRALNHTVQKHYMTLAVGGIVFGVVCVAGISQVKVESSGLSFFKDNSKLVTQSRALSQDFGGVVSFDIAIAASTENELKNADVMNVLTDFSDWLKQTYPQDIKVTLSLADYVEQMAKAYNGSNDRHYRFQNNDEVQQYLEVYSWKANLEDDLRNVVDEHFQYGRITGRFALLEQTDGTYRESSLQEQKQIIQQAESWLTNHLPAGFRVQPFGEMMIATEVNDRIIRGQITSLSLATIAVFLVVTIAFRSIRLGFLGLVPVLIAIGINFGLMGLLGIPLNIATALVSTMAIGIGIDDAIHFITTYQHRLRQSNLTNQALMQTFSGAGRAIIYTTMALVGGYTIMLFSQFTPVVYFGFLNIVTIVFATLATLIVLPSLLLLTQPNSSHKSHLSATEKPLTATTGDDV